MERQSGSFQSGDGKEYSWNVDSFTYAGGELERHEGHIPSDRLDDADFIYIKVSDGEHDWMVTLYGPYTDDEFVDEYLEDWFDEEEYGEV